MALTITAMHDPWQDLDRLPDWTVTWAPTPTAGLTTWATRTIALDPHLTAAEERSVLQHEVIHAERGPFPRWATAREEAAVRRESARRLITTAPLADALAWSLDVHELADELHVDVDTIHARLTRLDHGERAYLTIRTEHHGC